MLKLSFDECMYIPSAPWQQIIIAINLARKNNINFYIIVLLYAWSPHYCSGVAIIEATEATTSVKILAAN